MFFAAVLHDEQELIAWRALVEQLKEALVSSSSTAESSSSKEDNKRSLACPTPVCVVCLGLGSIADSIKSRDQYALLQALIVDLAEVVSLVLLLWMA